MQKMSRVRALTTLGLLAACCAGCGSGTTSAHTTTITAKQAANQDQALTRCGSQALLNTTTSAACRKTLNAPAVPTVTRCGHGLTTNTSCVFAHNVQHAYQAATHTYGKPPTGMTVTTNPVACASTSNGWRCRSRRNTAVWVTFTR